MEISSLEAWQESLPTSPKDVGRVELCVLRPNDGERALPETLDLSVEGGIHGDIWDARKDPERKTQVSLMNVHVNRSCAESEDPKRMALSGDNLLVDLDLSTENLPTGTVLEIGEVQLVVSDQPHLPCKLFAGRYGQGSVTRIAWSVKQGHRGRGVLCQIKRAGQICVGDEIRVSRV